MTASATVCFLMVSSEWRLTEVSLPKVTSLVVRSTRGRCAQHLHDAGNMTHVGRKFCA
jgi:hypothetical protein